MLVPAHHDGPQRGLRLAAVADIDQWQGLRRRRGPRPAPTGSPARRSRRAKCEDVGGERPVDARARGGVRAAQAGEALSPAVSGGRGDAGRWGSRRRLSPRRPAGPPRRRGAGDVVLVLQQHAQRLVDRVGPSSCWSRCCSAPAQSIVSATPGSLNSRCRAAAARRRRPGRRASPARPAPGGQDGPLARRVGVVHPLVEAAPADGVVHLPRAVAGEDHHRRDLGLDGAEFRDGELDSRPGFPAGTPRTARRRGPARRSAARPGRLRVDSACSSGRACRNRAVVDAVCQRFAVCVAGRPRPGGCSSAAGHGSTHRPRPRGRGRHSIAAAPAGAAAPWPAPWRSRSCRCRARPRGTAAGPSGARGARRGQRGVGDIAAAGEEVRGLRDRGGEVGLRGRHSP